MLPMGSTFHLKLFIPTYFTNCWWCFFYAMNWISRSNNFKLFHDGGRYHIETSPLICFHWFLCDNGLRHERVKNKSSHDVMRLEIIIRHYEEDCLSKKFKRINNLFTRECFLVLDRSTSKKHFEEYCEKIKKFTDSGIHILNE